MPADPPPISFVLPIRWHDSEGLDERAARGLAVSSVALAEAGRRRAGARAVFPAGVSLLAPAWVLERAVCSWLALASRLWLGGVPYAGTVTRRAATPRRRLARRAATMRAARS